MCRLLGNYGAHPDDDGLNDISMLDAEMTLKTTISILEVFIRDWKSTSEKDKK